MTAERSQQKGEENLRPFLYGAQADVDYRNIGMME
jgi:hypothetical protein